MVSLWKSLRKPMWNGCGVAVEKVVENRACGFLCDFCCGKLCYAAKKSVVVVNKNSGFSGKRKQRGLVNVSTISTIST